MAVTIGRECGTGFSFRRHRMKCTLIEIARECFCLRPSDGSCSVGAYLTRASALAAAERRGWVVVATEKRPVGTFYQERLARRQAEGVKV